MLPLMDASAEQLAASFDCLAPVYVLVDPMVGEPAMVDAPDGDPQAAREAGWERAITHVALSPRCTLPPHQQPYLVALQGPDDPLLALTLELAHDERREAMADGLDGSGMAVHRIGGWLQSSMHPADLAARLGAIFSVNTEARTDATYLRLADRRALALVRHVTGDARLGAQFGRLQRWVYLDLHGKLATLDSPAEQDQVLRLTRGEWLALADGEAVHRTLAQWLGEAERAGDPRPAQSEPGQLFTAAQAALALAATAALRWPHRFPTLADQTAWAALSLLHPALAHSAAAAALLDEPGSADDPPEPFRYLHHDVRALLEADGHGASAAPHSTHQQTFSTGRP